jgi:flagellar hook-length control protein FliK
MDRPDPSAKAPPSLSDSLAARLREGASDIVRSAQVVLRDGDAGLIRLRLEPESLGNVKIELKMTEKQISGKIVVESDIAGDAFKASIDSLRDAFAESGFETTELEIEVRNGMSFGTEADGEAGEDGRKDGDPYFSRSLRSLTAAVPAFGSGGRDGLLNMIV